MSKDYKVETWGKGNFIIVMNYPYNNDVVNFRYNNKNYMKKQEYAIGFWKPKNK